MSKEYTRRVSLLDSVPFAGQILHYNDFEHLLKLNFSGTDGDYIFELDPTFAFQGAQSLHIKTRTTDAAPGDHIDPYFYSYFLPTKIFTFTKRFLIPSLAPLSYYLIKVVFYDGAATHSTYLKWTPATPLWEYLNSGNTLSPLPGSDFDIKENVWHYISYSINFSTGHYNHLQIDHIFFDMSDIPIFINPVVSPIQLQTSFTLFTAGAAPVEMWIDELLNHAF